MHPLLHALTQLLQGNHQQGHQAQPQPQPQNELVNGYRPQPGYYDAAVRYDQDMKSGKYNSPNVVGVDPKFFGYPPDGPPQPPTTQTLHGSLGAPPVYALDQLLQGGQYNPGYTPLQTAQYASKIQPANKPVQQLGY